MTISPTTRQQLSLAVIIGTALGCIFSSLVVIGLTLQPAVVAALNKSPTPTVTPTHTPTATPTHTATPTPLPSPTLTATPESTATVGGTGTRTPLPARTPRPVVQHFLLGRPVGPGVPMNYPDPVYLYGTTEGGQYDVHHGEEFENPIGTPLYAVADGTIVAAGSDAQPICGDDYKTVCGASLSPETGGYYGKLIVIRLWQDYSGAAVFALYGHVNSISVEVGDDVKQGDLIGTIGMSGVAVGPHVHFETRLGSNDYAHTRNPILWMTPLPARGALVGRFTDAKGNLVRSASVNIFRTDDTFLLSTETYGRDKFPAVNSDDDLGENFAVGDLPVGDYIVRIAGQPLSQRVTIQDGKLAFVEIGGAP
ncbi:MAG: M23 family metallopeptidase [Chloroflexota bacterium]|nr:M23 family metallopeptidase [Chloroflexota bacterium]